VKFNQVTWYSKLLALILFVALPFLGFYAGMKYQQAIEPVGDKDGVADNPPTNGSGWKTIVENNQVVVKTKYEGDTLKYTGTAQLPTPCHQLKQEALAAESYPEQVSIRLTLKLPLGSNDCAQVIKEESFSGEAKVSEEATVSVFLNGTRVE